MSGADLTRWRLLLGPQVDDWFDQQGAPPLSGEQRLMDQALAAIYDETQQGFRYGDDEQRSASREASAPYIARWLADVRRCFPRDVVSVLQADAMERRGLKQLLLEPETLAAVKPDMAIVTTLMALKDKVPEQTKAVARQVVQAVVDDINQRLESQLKQAVSGAVNRRAHSPIPHAASIDWKTTIGKNLRSYNVGLRRLVPERVYFFDRARRSSKWTVVLAMDQSGSMAESVVYGAVCGAVLASMAALKTHVVAFDTAVVDLTEQCGDDPVDMLYGVQLGGGTDINGCVGYCRQLIEQPQDTVFILLTDLYEGGNQAQLYAQLEDLQQSGVTVIVLTALSDRGHPAYDHASAKRIAVLGIPCFACTPNRLPQLLERALKKESLTQDE